MTHRRTSCSAGAGRTSPGSAIFQRDSQEITYLPQRAQYFRVKTRKTRERMLKSGAGNKYVDTGGTSL
ncbi:hypothetical protein AORI_4854 [Amycolatopsis keratiniphila]|uniref:Uncharacterized protein n=1 Tax=Amycolatopsis keratiniphila TaxID=129921 RepID=R4TAC2_9PSEU|nr:hypothetical protein AORI_4854 [Amycolatopsis keratiniphila]